MKRYFKSLWRNIRNNPLFTTINFFGLTLGFASVIVIIFWINDEMSYDRFHANHDNIYRVHRYFYDEDGTENLHLPRIAAVIAPLLKNDFPEIEKITRIYYNSMVFKVGDKKFRENNFCLAEPELLEIFSFKGLPDDNTLLTEPFTIIVSEEVAYKYFNTPDVIGKSLEYTHSDGSKYEFNIVGTYKKWKKNTHLDLDIIASFETLKAFVDLTRLTNWSYNNYETFALINHLPANIDQKLDDFIDNYDRNSNRTKIRLEKLTSIHFNWYSSLSYIYIFASTAFLILILGTINYINLNTALYSKRLKELTLKKIIGASQKKLITGFIFESMLFCSTALIIALCLAPSVIPFLSKLFGRTIEFNFFENIQIIIGLFVLSLATGIISGIYPALSLSYGKPDILTKKFIHTKSNLSFRSSLVIFQFIVSIVLIISFLFVSNQLKFISKKELGFDKENIVAIPATNLLIEKLDVFKQELLHNPNIISVAASFRVPSSGLLDNSGASVISNGENVPIGFRLPNVRFDQDFIKTYKLKILAGRDFYENNNNNREYILNEEAVKMLGWKSPHEAIGQTLRYGGRLGQVIGVVNDFHYESIHNVISPIIMYNDHPNYNMISIRIIPDSMNKTLAMIEKTWQNYNISNEFYSYRFISDRYNRLYREEQNTKTLFKFFVILAILIAVSGLVGLSVFLTDSRIKEIGIRKVNGAKVFEILTLLNSNLFKWMSIAFFISCPIGWFLIKKWLENFAYKINLDWWVFAMAGFSALAVALLTVSFQSWRAARRNPVEALRYE